MKNFYITTPIYYVNDKPHIGHAYTSLACDVMARFKRLDGFDVRLLSGTDEHGQKIQKSAEAKGIDPQTFTDQVSQNFRDLLKALNISNDDFIRTTEPRHKLAAQALWKKLIDKGEIYLGEYEGWYAVRDEAFYTESELQPGPDADTKIAPSGAECKKTKETSYMFRLSAWGDRLLAFYDENPDCIMPASRRNEVISFVKGGLRDLAVSRSGIKWGIPVPNQEEGRDEKHVMYVWLDALTNYITALGYPDTDADLYKKFWPADLHMVGKDILRFHAVYWPAFLMAAGLAPPKRVFAHGWWTNEGQKISKSLGNVIDPYELLQSYGLDQTRYFLMREVPFGGDGDFSRDAMIRRINSDLANGIGNLAQRSLSQIAKNCDGKVPQPGDFTDTDKKLLEAARLLPAQVRAEIDLQAFHKALDVLWRVIGEADIYINDMAPWSLKKTDTLRMGTVLYVVADVLRRLGILLQPFMPETSGKLLDQLGVAENARAFANLDQALVAGTALPAPQGLFPRYIEPTAA